MEIELIDTLDNHAKYGIIYSREDIKECLNQEVELVKPDIKLKGFRPGKVPNDYIVSMYGEKLRIQAMNKKVTADILGIISDNKYTLASQPVYNFRPRQETDDSNFYVELDLFLMPNLPEIEFDKITVTKNKPNEEAFQEILDKNLLMFQIMTADFNSLETGIAQESDRVTFSMDVCVNEEPVPNLCGQMQAILGQEQIPLEIESQIKGLEIGQEVVYVHSYPTDAEDLMSPALAGAETTYKIKLDKIDRPVIQELDEDKIQKIGFKDHEHLLEVLEKNTHSTMDNISFTQMKHDFFEMFKTFYADVKLPDFIVEQEANMVAISELSVANPDVDVMEQITTGTLKLETTDAHKERAKFLMAVGLFIKKYSTDNNITINDSELKQELERHLSELTHLNKVKPEQKEQNYRQVYAKARAIIMETKVLKHVFDCVIINEVPLSKDDFFKAIKNVVN
jgi:trigger factor